MVSTAHRKLTLTFDVDLGPHYMVLLSVNAAHVNITNNRRRRNIGGTGNPSKNETDRTVYIGSAPMYTVG